MCKRYDIFSPNFFSRLDLIWKQKQIEGFYGSTAEPLLLVPAAWLSWRYAAAVDCGIRARVRELGPMDLGIVAEPDRSRGRYHD